MSTGSAAPHGERQDGDGAHAAPAGGAGDPFAGPGEMRAQCRALDWGTTPLGPVAGWPHSLRTVAALVLAAPTPMIVLWGPALVQLYNDAYRAIMGAKHPRGLGQPNRECWPEAWEFTAPIYAAVMERGEALTFVDQRLVLERHGYPEETFFTLAYSPAPDDAGGAGGVLVTVIETTAQVRARVAREAERERLLAESEAARARVTATLESIGEGFYAVDADFRFTYVNRRAEELLQRPRAALLGRVLWEAFPQARGTEADERYHRAMAERRPVEFEMRSAMDGRPLEVSIYPDAASGGLACYFRDLTPRREAEAALREREAVAAAQLAQLEAIYRDAPVGLAVLDRELRYLRINDRLARMNGVAAEAHVGRTVREILPGVADDVDALARRVLETGEPVRDVALAAETRAAPGVVRHFVEQWYPLRDPGGAVVGINVVVEEVTDRLRADAALRASEAKYRALFDSLDAGFCIIEVLFEPDGTGGARAADYRFLEVNPAFIAQTGLTDAIGRTIRELAPAHEAHWFEIYGRVALTGVPARFEAPAEALGRWYEVYAFRGGEPEERRVAVLFTDVRAKRMAEREREQLVAELRAANAELRRLNAEARADERRSAFLAELGEVLQPLEDPDAAMAATARLLGGYLGVDRCAYAEVEEDEDNFVITGDYTRGDTRSIVGRWAFHQFGADVLRLMRANAAYVVDDVDADARVTAADRPAYAATQIQAVICVPLRKAGRFVAAMAVHQRVARRWTPDEIELVVTVVRRCWESLERARAYRSLREREAALQATSTQLAERTGAAEAAQQAAEAANRAKGDFLAVMSHELRTPLNAIGGYAELIELGIHGPVTGEQRQALDRIQQSQRHLLGLINQVLNYTRVDAGAVRYDPADVLVREAIVAAEALVLPQVRARGLRYVLGTCAPELVARADPEKLQQVLLNLLTNAIKFTEPGGEVRVTCEARGGMVALAVADTGIGIAADKLTSIFEPFVQVDQRHTRPHEGVGLGLAISRDLARGMGGDLTAASEPGAGSTFTLTMPRG